MSSLVDPEPHDGTDNTFVLTVLGLLRLTGTVDDLLPPASVEPSERLDREPTTFEHLLLGVMAIHELVGDLVAEDPDDSHDHAEPTPPTTTDSVRQLLR